MKDRREGVEIDRRDGVRAADRQPDPPHLIGPISCDLLINHKRRGVFKPQLLSSEWSHVLLSLSVSSLPLLSITPTPGKVSIKSDSRVLIIVLLSLLWDKPFTCDNRCQGHFISTMIHEPLDVSRMEVTAPAFFILMMQHKNCFQTRDS